MDQLVALAGLILIFLLAYWRQLPMGGVALTIAYFLGIYFFGFSAHDISAGFPGHLIVTLIGVTYLFGIGHVNGTVDLIVASLVRAVRGKVVWIPWVFFVLALGITASGALSIATLSILMPIGMSFAHKNKINPVLMGLSIINGTNAGGFSPVAVYYLIVSGVLANEGIMLNAISMFLFTMIASLLLNIVAFFVFGGRSLIRRSREDGRSGPSSEHLRGSDLRWDVTHILTVVTMISVILATLLLHEDVGYMAMTGALVMAAFHPEDAQEGLKRIAWGIVLLIGGMVTYVNVLDSAGVIRKVANEVAELSTPLISALILCYVAAFITMFASSNAMFVIVAPLAAPLMLSGEVAVLGFAVALVLSVVMTDCCPISTAGALVVANSQEHKQQRVFNTLGKWTILLFLIIPLLTWTIFVVLPS